MSSEPSQTAPTSALNKLKGVFGLGLSGNPSTGKTMAPIHTHAPLERQDSYPEICSTPSEVGIFEVAHNAARGPDGKFSWKKFFEAPSRSTPREGPAATGASGTAASGQ